MSLRQKDKNRAELIKAIIKQNGGRIFTVIAKRKTPKHYFTLSEAVTVDGIDYSAEDKHYLSTKKMQKVLAAIRDLFPERATEHYEHFMEMTCRTGVKSQLAANKPTGYLGIQGTSASDKVMTVEEFEALPEQYKGFYEPVFKETKSTISHVGDLISVNLTNGKGYRCFSAFNVLEIRAGGAQLRFKEEDVLSCETPAN